MVNLSVKWWCFQWNNSAFDYASRGYTLGLCVHMLIEQTSPMIRMPAENKVVEVSVLFTDSLYQLGRFLAFPAPCCSCEIQVIVIVIQIIVKWHFECLLNHLVFEANSAWLATNIFFSLCVKCIICWESNRLEYIFCLFHKVPFSFCCIYFRQSQNTGSYWCSLPWPRCAWYYSCF